VVRSFARRVFFLSLTSDRRHELHTGYSFDQYAKDHNKVYSGAKETAFRRGLFEKGLAEVLAHNADATVRTHLAPCSSSNLVSSARGRWA
jgi:hypothetical protein